MDLKDRLPPVSIIESHRASAVSGQVAAIILCKKSQTVLALRALGNR